MTNYITLKDTYSYGDAKHREHPFLKVKVNSTRHIHRGKNVMYEAGWRKIVFGQVNGRGYEYAFPVGTRTRFKEVK